MEPDRPKKLVGVSTKMYFDVAKTKQYVNELLEQLPGLRSELESVDVFFIPDFISVCFAVERLKDTRVMVGAQDCFYEDTGAYTGEVSPKVLAEVGCKIVELGHAERRRIFNETNEETARKAAATSRNGMIPLVCIGEKTKGDVSVAVAECKDQIGPILNSISANAEIIFAYEPVWAIGQSEPASAEYVVEVAQRLREITKRRAGTTRILYGGSAGPGLFEKLIEGVDGLFLGRFAHDSRAFNKTIQEIASAQSPRV